MAGLSQDKAEKGADSGLLGAFTPPLWGGEWAVPKLHDTWVKSPLLPESTLTWKSSWDCSGFWTSGGQGALSTASLAPWKEFIPLQVRKEILFIHWMCAYLEDSSQGLLLSCKLRTTLGSAHLQDPCLGGVPIPSLCNSLV